MPFWMSAHFAFGGRRLNSAAVLVFAKVERQLGIAEQLVRRAADQRAPEWVRQTLAEMARFRVLPIAGQQGANECNALRGELVFKMAAWRPPETGQEVPSQPTMLRKEDRPTKAKRMRRRGATLDLLYGSLAEAPKIGTLKSTQPSRVLSISFSTLQTF